MSISARRDTFQAIADPTRRDILSMIATEPRNLNAIAENFEVSRPAISQHIKILAECGLIIIKQQGRERFCYMQVDKLKEVNDWLEPFRELWEHRFDKLDNLLVKMQQKKSKPKSK